MKLLDLFCGAGGAAMGYHRAGFDEIIGVDLGHHPNYPYQQIRADALGHTTRELVARFKPDLIHASPPCQAYSWASKRWNKEWPDLVEAARELLLSTGLPYIIENVVGAPLKSPIVLCGLSFGLGVLRHRIFESSVPMSEPAHTKHEKPGHQTGTRSTLQSKYITVAGQGGESASYKLADWFDAMGVEQGTMTRKELTESIPPAYTEWLGRKAQAYLEA